MAPAALSLTLATSVGIVFVTYVLWQYFFSPLRSFPGPFVAKFTNIWRALDVAAGRPDITQKALHRRYGSAVRLGPNVITLSDPSLVKTIYNIRGNFVKSNFYAVNDVKVGGQVFSNLFGTRSNEYHAAQVKPIQKHYVLNSVLACEPLVDRTTRTLLQKLDERFSSTGKLCPIDEYLEYYAWDVIGEMTYGEPLGFLESGKDVQDIIKGAESSLDYFAVIGQLPWLDFLLDKNPVYPIGFGSFAAVTGLSIDRLTKRLQQSDQRSAGAIKDYLDLFLEKKGAPYGVNDQQVVGWLLINMLAGADTTAITLRAIVYYVLKNPTVHQRLRAELDAADLSEPISYKAVQTLSYLSAIISESCRVHPGVGLPLERIVPAEGLALPDGRFVPAGTIVGINPWVVHGNTQVYGHDADSFRPERWLRNVDQGESEDAYAARVKLMKDTDLTFGAGNRVCMGKHVSLVEAYKLTATLFREYDMEFTNPQSEWHVQNSWFVRQSNMAITMKRRALPG